MAILISSSIAQEEFVYRKRIVVEEGHGFQVHLRSINNVPWTSCNMVHTENKKIKVNNHIIIKDSANEEPLAVGNICVIRVPQATKGMEGEWMAIGRFAEDRDFKSDSFELIVSPKHDISACPTDPGQVCKIKYFPYMSQPKEWKTCSKNPEKEEYECHYSRKGTMEVSKVKLNMKTSTLPNIEFRDVIQIGGSQILECSVPKSTQGNLKGCVITRRNSDQSFSLQEGLYNLNYSSYLTDYTKRICQFEIPYKIPAYFEGIWTMQMILDNHQKHTCQYTVGDHATFVAEKRKNRSTVRNILLDHVTISCALDIPYKLTRCYFKSVDSGEKVKFSTNSNELLNGDCQLYVYDISKRNETNYICGFNGPTTSDKDIVREIKIRYHTSMAIDPRFSAENRTMECAHIYGNPLTACIFQAPNGTLYSVPSDEYESEEFEYHGPKNGFSRGNCGIKFHGEVEGGVWTCIIKSGDFSAAEVSFPFVTLAQPPPIEINKTPEIEEEAPKVPLIDERKDFVPKNFKNELEEK